MSAASKTKLVEHVIVKAKNLDVVFGIRKPPDESSATTVAKVKSALLKALLSSEKDIFNGELAKNDLKRLHAALKVGHGGTLDPLATGVLVIGVGRGCRRLTEFLGNTIKGYRAVGRLGVAYDTYDRTGMVIEQKPWDHVTVDQLEQALNKQFMGTIKQRPPLFSAIHINGQRAYEIARNRQKLQSGATQKIEKTTSPDTALELPEREITIYKIQVTKGELPDFTIEMECSSGTYVRSLIHDLGQAVGCVATMMELERIRQGSIYLDQCIGIDQITDWKSFLALIEIK